MSVGSCGGFYLKYCGFLRFFSRDFWGFLVLLRMMFYALGLTKVPFGKYVLFFLGFLSKS